ncbi:hypothetical protein GCM10022254_16280 [Actinomadura meridiana]|uniref:Deoxyribonuclease NucA/NucB domain-containing protein n=1 Tax=Actinomadura meridiana TaxID=559626 RepID=A0ABP8BVP0_9ACTN
MEAHGILSKYYQNLYVTGELNPYGHTTQLSIDCAAVGCGSPGFFTFVAKKNVVQTGTHFMESPGPTIAYPEPQTKVLVSYPRATIEWSGGKPWTHVGPPTGIRCDSLKDVVSTNKPGCVYYWYTPTYVVDFLGPMPNIARNILYGQLALRTRPGFPGTDSIPGGQVLVRGPRETTDPDNPTGKIEFDKLSRDVACPKSIPRPPGQNCDEYPFASTWQGAHWVPATEWTCKFVPKGENDFQGGDITKFFNQNRLWRNPTGKVIDSTGRKQGAFWVSVTNSSTTPPSFKQCQDHM